MYIFHSNPTKLLLKQIRETKDTREALKILTAAMNNKVKKALVTVVAEYKDNKLNFAVSRCSVNDDFNRKKGLKIARGRLEKGKIYTTKDLKFKGMVEVPVGQLFLQYAKQIAQEVSKHKKFEYDTEEVLKLKRELKTLAFTQNYEAAAKVRDKLRISQNK